MCRAAIQPTSRSSYRASEWQTKAQFKVKKMNGNYECLAVDRANFPAREILAPSSCLWPPRPFSTPFPSSSSRTGQGKINIKQEKMGHEVNRFRLIKSNSCHEIEPRERGEKETLPAFFKATNPRWRGFLRNDREF